MKTAVSSLMLALSFKPTTTTVIYKHRHMINVTLPLYEHVYINKMSKTCTEYTLSINMDPTSTLIFGTVCLRSIGFRGKACIFILINVLQGNSHFPILYLM